MEIDNVRKEDAGTYICTASNNVGTISADQIELRVLCKHIFLPSWTHITFLCKFAFPDISWPAAALPNNFYSYFLLLQPFVV
jgi:hypothetical protein